MRPYLQQEISLPIRAALRSRDLREAPQYGALEQRVGRYLRTGEWVQRTREEQRKHLYLVSAPNDWPCVTQTHICTLAFSLSHSH